MKTAIVFSGFPRSYKRDYNHYYKMIFSKFNADIYAHLWKHDSRDPDPRDMVNIYKFKDCIIDCQKDFENSFYTRASSFRSKGLADSTENAYRCLSMFYSKYKAFELVKNSKIKYDIVILMRTELSFFRPLYRCEKIKAKSKMLIPFGFGKSVNDLFCVTNMEYADVYTSLYQEVNRLVCDKLTKCDQHVLLKARLDECNIPVETIDFPIYLRDKPAFI